MARFATAAGQQKASASATLLALVAGLRSTHMAVDQADATREPANQVAAAASNMRDISGTHGSTPPILNETVRVSSTSDLILSTTLECALITQVITGDEETVPE